MRFYHFMRDGMLAIEPRALFQAMPEPAKRENRTLANCVVVDVCGPLDHHLGTFGGWCDSYEAISGRFDEALKSSRGTVVLSIDSPGGMVSGCFELARSMRARAASAGKRLFSYVNGQACSAAYALACAGEQIYVPETGAVGSIGIINTRIDMSALNAAMGTKISLITSGERKGDGNPNAPMSDDELAESQKIVNAMASVFFGLVAEMRGKPADSIAALQARIVFGTQAVQAGLADKVASFDELLAALASPDTGDRMSKYSDARAALEEAAKGDDEEAKKAKRALAAMDGDDEKKDDEKKDDESAKAKAEGEEEEKPAEEARASTSVGLAAIVNDQGKRLAAIERERESTERSALLASRPDLTPELSTYLASQPLVEVKKIVAGIKKPAAPNLAASATVTPTRGAGQGTAQDAPSSDLGKVMDRRMGLTKYEMGVRLEGTAQTFGIVEVADAKGGVK